MVRTAICAFGVLLALASGTVAADQTVEAKWGALGPLIANQKIALVLPDGTTIQGKGISAGTDGLRMKVSRTSNKKLVAKGERVIPRSSVSVVRMTQHHGVARLLVPAAAVAVSVAIVATQDIDTYEGALVVIVPVVAAGGIAGGAVAGYYIGKRIDRKVTYIRIAKED